MAPQRKTNRPTNYTTTAIVVIGLLVFFVWVFVVPSHTGVNTSEDSENEVADATKDSDIKSEATESASNDQDPDNPSTENQTGESKAEDDPGEKSETNGEEDVDQVSNNVAEDPSQKLGNVEKVDEEDEDSSPKQDSNIKSESQDAEKDVQDDKDPSDSNSGDEDTGDSKEPDVSNDLSVSRENSDSEEEKTGEEKDVEGSAEEKDAPGDDGGEVRDGTDNPTDADIPTTLSSDADAQKDDEGTQKEDADAQKYDSNVKIDDSDSKAASDSEPRDDSSGEEKSSSEGGDDDSSQGEKAFMVPKNMQIFDPEKHDDSREDMIKNSDDDNDNGGTSNNAGKTSDENGSNDSNADQDKFEEGTDDKLASSVLDKGSTEGAGRGDGESDDDADKEVQDSQTKVQNPDVNEGEEEGKKEGGGNTDAEESSDDGPRGDDSEKVVPEEEVEKKSTLDKENNLEENDGESQASSEVGNNSEDVVKSDDEDSSQSSGGVDGSIGKGSDDLEEKNLPSEKESGVEESDDSKSGDVNSVSEDKELPYSNKDASGGGDEPDAKRESSGLRSKQSDDRSDTRWGEVISKEALPGAQKVQDSGSDQSANEDVPTLDSTHEWPLCDSSTVNSVPCFTISSSSIKRSSKYFERNCPSSSDLTELADCIIPPLEGYKTPLIKWPSSKNQIWFNNVPREKVTLFKRNMNYMRREEDKFVFTPQPGKKNRMKSYVAQLQEVLPKLELGSHVQVALDVGSNLASFSAFLSKLNVTVFSISHKDKRVGFSQFALERGLPSLISVFGTRRLPFPSNSFDLIHCLKCRVPWEENDGMYLIEANRILRPQGYFVLASNTIFNADSETNDLFDSFNAIAKKMCWRFVVKLKGIVGIAIWQKPKTNICFNKRPHGETLHEFCDPSVIDQDSTWNVPLQNCIYRIPFVNSSRTSLWPPKGAERYYLSPLSLLSSSSSSLKSNLPSLDTFNKENKFWGRAVSRAYLLNFGIDWSRVRNVMDMSAHFGGFSAALHNYPVWVMNVVPINHTGNLGLIYDRGLVGVYHDWCEPFDTFPRTYDLLHADNLLSKQSLACDLKLLLVEMDRILRPEGYVIVRDTEQFLVHLNGVVAHGLGWKSVMWNARSGHAIAVYKKPLSRTYLSDKPKLQRHNPKPRDNSKILF